MTPTPDVSRATAHDLAADVHAQADAAIAARGRFVLVLAGGTTPAPLYRAVDLLGRSRTPSAAPVRWERWTALLTDERCLPAGHPDRNDQMVAATLPALTDAGRLRTVPDGTDPDASATAYERVVADVVPIDLAILGLGADGHTAGVFASTTSSAAGAPDADRACVGVHDAPEPFPQRVTLTLATLAAARQVWFVVDATDRAKDAAVARLARGEGHAARAAGRERTRLVLLEPATAAAVRT